MCEGDTRRKLPVYASLGLLLSSPQEPQESQIKMKRNQVPSPLVSHDMNPSGTL